MTALDVLTDGFDRVRDSLRQAADGLSPEHLEARLDADANSIGWLLWHTTRVQDAQMADLAGSEEVWTSGGWAERFSLDLDPADTGYGHSPKQVAAVRDITAEQFVDYHEATHERTRTILAGLSEADLERVVDGSYDPPVTLVVRLVSILADDLEHVGQAAFARGLLERR